MSAVKWMAECPSHPEDGEHECMPGERRCVYCGQVIEAYPCHGCGDFLSAKAMHAARHDGIRRCEDCT